MAQNLSAKSSIYFSSSEKNLAAADWSRAVIRIERKASKAKKWRGAI
jgi:hypothetical protein